MNIMSLEYCNALEAAVVDSPVVDRWESGGPTVQEVYHPDLRLIDLSDAPQPFGMPESLYSSARYI